MFGEDAVPGTSNLMFMVGKTVRLAVARAQGHLLMIVVQAPTPTEFDAFDAQAEKILDTLTFDP